MWNFFTSANKYPDLVSYFLYKGMTCVRILGRFVTTPIPSIAFVPEKTPKKFCIINDLSYPKIKSSNDCTSKSEFSFGYVTVNKAISFIQELGKGCYL